MSQKRKNRSTAATVERAGREFAGSFSPCRNLTTTEHFCQSGQVSSILPVGRANAIPGHSLVKALGLRDLRALTQKVEKERRAGAPICAAVSGTSRGYYLAAGPLELSQYINSLDRRLRAVGETRRHLSTALDKLTGQASMAGW